MAARGGRELEDDTRELLTDPEDVAYFRKQARRIYLRTFLATLAVIIAGRGWLWYRG